MDVQGFELPALAGCEGMLDRFAWIYVECWFMELYAGQALADEVIAGCASASAGFGWRAPTTWPMTAKAARCRRIFCLGGAVWPRAVDCAGAIAARAPLLQDIGCRRPALGPMDCERHRGPIAAGAPLLRGWPPALVAAGRRSYGLDLRRGNLRACDTKVLHHFASGAAHVHHDHSPVG